MRAPGTCLLATLPCRCIGGGVKAAGLQIKERLPWTLAVLAAQEPAPSPSRATEPHLLLQTTEDGRETASWSPR